MGPLGNPVIKIAVYCWLPRKKCIYPVPVYCTYPEVQYRTVVPIHMVTLIRIPVIIIGFFLTQELEPGPENQARHG